MKTWRKYENLLMKGEWHVHTSYVDGENSVREVCRTAEEKGIPLVAFTEHVRRDLTYDFNRFLEDVDKARGEFNLIILSGCEVKVLPNGNLDALPEMLEAVDYPILAFHSFPQDIDMYMKSLGTALGHPMVNTWAHPGLLPMTMGWRVDLESMREIFDLMRREDVLLEVNSKYHLPSKEWMELALVRGVKPVRGSDIHSTEDILAMVP